MSFFQRHRIFSITLVDSAGHFSRYSINIQTRFSRKPSRKLENVTPRYFLISPGGITSCPFLPVIQPDPVQVSSREWTIGSNGEFWRITRQASLRRRVPDSSKLTARLHVAIIAKQRAPVRETAAAKSFRHDGWRRSCPKNLDVCQRWEKIGRRVARRQRLPVCLAIQDDVTRESAEEGWR